MKEKRLEEIIAKAVQEIMHESSISQKKRDNKDVERFYRRGKTGFNHIKTLVVFTAENPNSTEVTRSQNKKLNKSLLKTLKDAGYKFVPAIGQFYGNPEHPYIVFNMSLKTAKRLCGRYEQTSFIWGQLDGNGGVLSQDWEKQDVTSPYNIHYNDYVLKDESNEWTDQTDAEDGFTLVGKHFKYPIPFSIFESINAKFGENIKQICEQEMNNGHMMSGDEILDFAINGVGLSPSLYRKAIIKDS